MTNLEKMGALAKDAARTLRIESASEKTRALELIASALIAKTDDILAANTLDVEAAKGNLSPSMIDRLSLSEQRIQSMACLLYTSTGKKTFILSASQWMRRPT